MLRRLQDGQTIIEVLVGVMVAVLLLGALTVMIIYTFANIDESQNNNEALQIAQDGMEYIKSNQALVKNNPPSTYCLPLPDSIYATSTTLNTTPSSTCSDTSTGSDATGTLGTPFYRTVAIENNAIVCPNGGTDPYSDYSVAVSVGWHDKKCDTGPSYFCHVSSIQTCISNTTALPTGL